MYTFGLYTMALSPCFFSPLADSLLLPFLILYLLGTLLAAIGSVHPGPRLFVNWSPHFHPSPSAPHLFPICFPFRNPDPLWFSQVNAPFTKTTLQLWFPRTAQACRFTLQTSLDYLGSEILQIWEKRQISEDIRILTHFSDLQFSTST
jgi:hypothetical protein